jgi:hypothetical protein
MNGEDHASGILMQKSAPERRLGNPKSTDPACHA